MVCADFEDWTSLTGVLVPSVASNRDTDETELRLLQVRLLMLIFRQVLLVLVVRASFLTFAGDEDNDSGIAIGAKSGVDMFMTEVGVVSVLS